MKIPPIRMVEFPVSANLTGTTEPTERWSLFAVVVSISKLVRRRGPKHRVPESMRKMMVSERWRGDTAVTFASECRNSNSPL